MEEENTGLMKLTPVKGFLFLPIEPKSRALWATTAQSVSRCTVIVDLKIVQQTCERRKRAKNNHARGRRGKRVDRGREWDCSGSDPEGGGRVHSPGKIKKRHCGTKYRVFQLPTSPV